MTCLAFLLEKIANSEEERAQPEFTGGSRWESVFSSTNGLNLMRSIGWGLQLLRPAATKFCAMQQILQRIQ